ncbi:MAG: Asp-tRNA(Asn)/Glu-tRNA(Gln) amidotransferase GatCAB subunit B, partial [Candidatus Omnitrophota bacterium]
KEEAQDYRYFPEPDLVPFTVDAKVIDDIRNSLPELPEAREKRFVAAYGLPEYDAHVLTSDVSIADYFEECAKMYPNRKGLANWVIGDVMAAMNLKGVSIYGLGIEPAALAELLNMIDVQAISGKIAKDVLAEMIDTKKRPQDIVRSRGLSQISDKAAIEKAVKEVLVKNEKSVNDYKSGKKTAITFLVGQVMRQTQGKANPALVNQILKEMLGE